MSGLTRRKRGLDNRRQYVESLREVNARVIGEEIDGRRKCQCVCLVPLSGKSCGYAAYTFQELAEWEAKTNAVNAVSVRWLFLGSSTALASDLRAAGAS